MPAPDNDKALNGLLQRSLRRSVPAGDCPPPDILAAYQEGSLAADELARHELHFSTCARCREQLATMSRTAAEAEMEVPALAAKAAASEGFRAAAPRGDHAHPRRRIWFLDWRLLAPVAAALAFTAILYTRLMNRPATSSGPKTEVAMSKQEAPPSSVAERPAPPSQPAETRAAPAPAPHAAQKTTPMARDRALFSKKAEEQPAAPSSEDRERAEAMARELERQRMSNSLEVDRSEAAGAGAVAGAAGAGARAGAGGAGAGFTGGRLRSNAVQAQRMKAPAAAGAPSAPAPAAPPSTADEAKQAEKPAPTTQAVTVTSQAVAVQAPEPAKEAAASTASPANLPINGRNAVQQITLSVERALIKTPDSAVMYRIADGGFIERTQDSGATWQGQQVDPSAQFVAGAAPSAKICWLVGNGGAVFLSKDGINWAKIPAPTKADLVAVTAANASSATVVTTDGRKFSTRDGGKTWTLLQ